MDCGIAGKVALVTAASKGLGRASAEELSREGCKVAICARNGADVQKAAAEISAETGNEVVPFTADVSSAAEIDTLLQGVAQKLGNPEILVINAGGPPPGNFDDTPLENYPAAIELTLMSGVRLTHGCLPAMRAKGWGRIVFIGSISIKQPIPNLLLSNMARAGLTGFMKTVANEMAATGVTINAVLPGGHLTDRIKQTLQKAAEETGAPMEKMLEQRAAAIPMKRIGDPREFGAVVAFLASTRASYLTGQSILNDGGSYLGLM